MTGFFNSNVAVPVTITNFVRQVEDINTACGALVPAAFGVSGAYKPNALNGYLRDVANNVPAVNPVVTAIAAASVTTGTSFTALAAALDDMDDALDSLQAEYVQAIMRANETSSMPLLT